MASRNLVQPHFPVPPDSYSSGYMAEVVRAFSTFLEQSNNPGEGRATNFTMTALANTDYGLETGALFAQNEIADAIMECHDPVAFACVACCYTPHLIGVRVDLRQYRGIGSCGVDRGAIVG